MAKNILMLLQTEYPPDIRLRKEISALLKYGHRVFLLVNNVKQRDRRETIEGCEVLRLPAFSDLPALVGKILRLPYPFNPLWYAEAIKIIQAEQINAIHAHDLPMAPFAYVLAKLFKISFVYDMHENYPAAMAEWNENASLAQKIFRNEKAALVLDKFCARKADRVIVVVDEMKRLLIERGLPDEKVYVVSNTVDVNLFDAAVFEKSVIEKYKDWYSILYLGKFSVERGLGTAIEAMPKIAVHIPNARLLLVGEGKNRGELEDFAKSVNADELVHFTGWVDFSQVPSYMKAAKICIVPQPSNPFIDTTIPHKIFQYMAIGRPVITSDAKPLKKVVEDCQSGEIFKSNDPDSFANAVIKVYQSDKNYGENGVKAVKEKYNWQNTARTLIRLYETL